MSHNQLCPTISCVPQSAVSYSRLCPTVGCVPQSATVSPNELCFPAKWEHKSYLIFHVQPCLYQLPYEKKNPDTICCLCGQLSELTEWEAGEMSECTSDSSEWCSVASIQQSSSSALPLSSPAVSICWLCLELSMIADLPADDGDRQKSEQWWN